MRLSHWDSEEPARTNVALLTRGDAELFRRNHVAHLGRTDPELKQPDAQ